MDPFAVCVASAAVASLAADAGSFVAHAATERLQETVLMAERVLGDAGDAAGAQQGSNATDAWQAMQPGGGSGEDAAVAVTGSRSREQKDAELLAAAVDVDASGGGPANPIGQDGAGVKRPRGDGGACAPSTRLAPDRRPARSAEEPA